MDAVVRELLKQQQDFMKDLLTEQRQWLEENNSVKSISSAPVFHAFDAAKNSWTTYLMQLEQHLEANKVRDDTQKRALFLSWIGEPTIDLLQKLFGDNNFGTFQGQNTCVSCTM